jgi:hypothetical protein
MTDDDKLIEAAGRLQKAIAPQRDLWPAIAEAIAAPQRSYRLPLLAQAAAVVLLVAGSSAMTWMIMKDRQQVPGTVMQGLVLQQASFGSHYMLGPEYQEARGDIEAQLEEELARLSPDMRREIESNLSMIRGAIAEINTALEDEPGNMLLQELLLKTYQEELVLMQRVGGLTRRVMARKDI